MTPEPLYPRIRHFRTDTDLILHCLAALASTDMHSTNVPVHVDACTAPVTEWVVSARLDADGKPRKVRAVARSEKAALKAKGDRPLIITPRKTLRTSCKGRWSYRTGDGRWTCHREMAVCKWRVKNALPGGSIRIPPTPPEYVIASDRRSQRAATWLKARIDEAATHDGLVGETARAWLADDGWDAVAEMSQGSTRNQRIENAQRELALWVRTRTREETP